MKEIDVILTVPKTPSSVEMSGHVTDSWQFLQNHINEQMDRGEHNVSIPKGDYWVSRGLELRFLDDKQPVHFNGNDSTIRLLPPFWDKSKAVYWFENIRDRDEGSTISVGNIDYSALR